MANWDTSGIAPNESNAFINEKEREELFGQEIKPDRMKIPSAQMLRESQVNPAWAADAPLNQSNAQFNEFQGEFTILRGFSGMEKAMQFSVCDP